MNRSALFFRALSRTPFNPWDIRSPLWVGWLLDCLVFSLVRGLPSATSASRPSASLVRLLRWYYAPVRLLSGVHARIVLLASRADPVGWLAPGCQRGLPVLARAVFRRAHGSWTTPGLPGTRVGVPHSVAFPIGAHGRRPVCVFRSSIPGPSVPLSMLHPTPHGTQRKTRGQDGSLLLSCGALSSPTARRFIPAIALRDRRGSVTFVSVLEFFTPDHEPALVFSDPRH